MTNKHSIVMYPYGACTIALLPGSPSPFFTFFVRMNFMRRIHVSVHKEMRKGEERERGLTDVTFWIIHKVGAISPFSNPH